MKNQGNLPSDEQLDKEFLETISALDDGLKKLDSLDVNTPDEHWFERTVLEQQEQLRRKHSRELGWFLISALFILSIVLFTLLELPQLFYLLQAAAVVVTVVYSYKGVQKQVDSQ
ncbi:YxlC family protein [Mesobacillus subterraneus]|uniref:YxlC family protein n=1 Tax=Mesobacillus subterraneus TaxID=285983 RepID=A0A3R9F3T7_9BACI|nr:YxlC family protein [Mesobacillus subterraneus]RSD29247.1 hypothetical protein EJA10_00930 [Mesobacillus subterraneus]